MIKEIAACRACGNRRLRPLAGFGEMHLPGSLLPSPSDRTPMVPVELVRCDDEAVPGSCGLVQLRHRVDYPHLSAPGYGGRSARHPAAVRHLSGIAARLLRHVNLGQNDVVLDIGSNDGTLLSCFAPGPLLIGMDPAAVHFRRQYRADVQIIPEAFAAEALKERLGGKRVKVVTAVAILDRLDDPLPFLEGIRQLLDDRGIACIELAYLPPILKHNAEDSIRPEIVAYYSVRQLLWLAERARMKVLDVFTNDSEAGCVAMTVARSSSSRGRPPSSLGWYLENEAARRLGQPQTWTEMKRRADEQKARLSALLERIGESGEKIVGWGVSAAGNALMDRWGIGTDRIPMAASSDPEAIGRFMPGTGIPVVSETEARASSPDYLLVLARHFREDILRGLDEFLLAGGRVVFPLPEVEIVTA